MKNKNSIFNKLFLAVLSASIFISPIYSMKRSLPKDLSSERVFKKSREPEHLLDLARNNSNVYEKILSLLDEQSKHKLALTSKTFFEKTTNLKMFSKTFFFKFIPSTRQGDDWRCGYFTAFNVYTIINILKNYKNLFIALAQLDINDAEGFNKFYEELFSKYPKKSLAKPKKSFTYAYKNQKCLRTSQLEDILSIKLEIQDLKNITNLSIISIEGIESLDELVKDNPILIEKKALFKTTGKPQIVVVKQFRHWYCVVITKSSAMLIDSYYYKLDQIPYCLDEEITPLFCFFNDKPWQH